MQKPTPNTAASTGSIPPKWTPAERYRQLKTASTTKAGAGGHATDYSFLQECFIPKSSLRILSKAIGEKGIPILPPVFLFSFYHTLFTKTRKALTSSLTINIVFSFGSSLFPAPMLSAIIKTGGTYMELRVLNYFLMVTREENITKAASPAPPHPAYPFPQLMQLEEELGVQLFTRSKHRIVLTDDGMLLPPPGRRTGILGGKDQGGAAPPGKRAYRENMYRQRGTAKLPVFSSADYRLS